MTEGMFRREADARNMLERMEIDSAGTIGWHAGRPPDPRAQAAAARRGVDISGLRSRLVTEEDVEHFDIIAAVDAPNFEQLSRMASLDQRAKLHKLLDFCADPGLRGRDVPDPFYEGVEGFEHALDLIALAVHGLVDHIAERNGNSSSTT
jgi:protein-tyrosine phosphatase